MLLLATGRTWEQGYLCTYTKKTSVFIEGLEVQHLPHKMFHLLSPLLGLPAIRCLKVGYTAGGGAGLHTREDSLQLLQLFCLALPQYTSPKGPPLFSEGGWGHRRGTGRRYVHTIGTYSLFTLAWNSSKLVHGMVLKNGSTPVYTSHHNRCVHCM